MACLYWLIMQLTIIIKLYVLKSPIESTLSSWNYRVMFRKRIGMLRPEKIQINNLYIVKSGAITNFCSAYHFVCTFYNRETTLPLFFYTLQVTLQDGEKGYFPQCKPFPHTELGKD